MRNIFYEIIFKNNYKHIKKGSILIECLCAFTIVSIVFTLGSLMLSKYYYSAAKRNYEVKEDFYLREAVLFIENEIHSERSANYDEKRNIITITKDNGDFEKVKLNSDPVNHNILINYYNYYGKYKGTNVIAKDISLFKIYKYNTYIVIQIKGKYKGEVEKCIRKESKDLH